MRTAALRTYNTNRYRHILHVIKREYRVYTSVLYTHISDSKMGVGFIDAVVVGAVEDGVVSHRGVPAITLLITADIRH